MQVRMWDIRSRELTHTVQASRFGNSRCVQTDGWWVVAGGADGTVRLYDQRTMRTIKVGYLQSNVHHSQRETAVRIRGARTGRTAVPTKWIPYIIALQSKFPGLKVYQFTFHVHVRHMSATQKTGRKV